MFFELVQYKPLPEGNASAGRLLTLDKKNIKKISLQDRLSGKKAFQKVITKDCPVWISLTSLLSIPRTTNDSSEIIYVQYQVSIY